MNRVRYSGSALCSRACVCAGSPRWVRDAAPAGVPDVPPCRKRRMPVRRRHDTRRLSRHFPGRR